MSGVITYFTKTVQDEDGTIRTVPAGGRGAWPNGRGGTLNAKGDGVGKFYRTATGALPAVGTTGFRANRSGSTVTIDDYATWRAVVAIQKTLVEEGFPAGTADGLFGPKTEEAVKQFQKYWGVTVDGIVGPQTSRELFAPLARDAAQETDEAHEDVVSTIIIGTVANESMWDPGAVGGLDCHDLGLGQLNKPSHSTLSENDCFAPKMALPEIARLIEGNLKAFNYNARDAIAAYNLGRGGAQLWISVGRPDLYTPPHATRERNMKKYIDKILKDGAA